MKSEVPRQKPCSWIPDSVCLERGKDTTGFAKNTGTETREKQLPFRDKYKLRQSELGMFCLVTTVGKMVEG